ncbi:hypothetical protein [Novosphingobium sp. CECT 9465]|uniref:hypothetical protein n=1 Tax=Novosphingobium sp. CECT 9465 TaxID=2829794 RepID=UPI001E401181|nr:hypothetical protein [Novosphingobium sp. CECT 9465]
MSDRLQAAALTPGHGQPISDGEHGKDYPTRDSPTRDSPNRDSPNRDRRYQRYTRQQLPCTEHL